MSRVRRTPVVGRPSGTAFFWNAIPSATPVIPAKAGIQVSGYPGRPTNALNSFRFLTGRTPKLYEIPILCQPNPGANVEETPHFFGHVPRNESDAMETSNLFRACDGTQSLVSQRPCGFFSARLQRFENEWLVTAKRRSDLTRILQTRHEADNVPPSAEEPERLKSSECMLRCPCLPFIATGWSCFTCVHSFPRALSRHATEFRPALALG